MRRFLTTHQLADALGIQAASIRAHVSRHGAYYGIKPMKAPNRRLLWPADAINRLLGEGGKAA